MRRRKLTQVSWTILAVLTAAMAILNVGVVIYKHYYPRFFSHTTP